METPTSTGHLLKEKRTPTPRLSERKKRLFFGRSKNLNQIDDDELGESLLSGISPLRSTRTSSAKNLSLVETGVGANKSLLHLLDKDGNKRLRSSSSSCSSSPETNKENKEAKKTRGGNDGAAAASDDQLPQLFTTTMRITNNASSCSTSSSPNISPQRPTSLTNCDAPLISEDETHSPKGQQNGQVKSSIPTNAFYSKGVVSSKSRLHGKTQSPHTDGSRRRSSKWNKSPSTLRRIGINKGVRHGIRKPAGPTSHSASHCNVDSILKSLRSDKLRNLITNGREQRAKIEQVHEIFRHAQNPIQMAKQLSIITTDDANNNKSTSKITSSEEHETADFSDFSDDELEATSFQEAASCESNSVMEPIIPIIRHDSCNTGVQAAGNRKFFKSGHRAYMEVKITNNIRASLQQGKISLVEEAPPKKRRRVYVNSTSTFSAEQATVDAILRNLDDTVVDDIVESTPQLSAATESSEQEELNFEPIQQEEINFEATLQSYESFHQRLPYNTDNPDTIKQQELLLEFLISNNICTEENFKIFITDPDNHKEEAMRIVDELYAVVNAENLAEQMQEIEASAVTVFESENTAQEPIVEAEKKLFPIFTQRLHALAIKSTRRKAGTCDRLLIGARGSNQYQIDAGQKAYGAKQCEQCGLVYTVHEPEEEKLHDDFHNSMQVLRFKGWIDEEVVRVCPQWSSDGRVIRMTEQSSTVRLERLSECIKLVDKELGYASFVMPTTFVSFLAIRKQKIVGICLVEPLKEAHRLMHIDGKDYLSEEIYEASCGISRIWVSPLQRRQGIATKLLDIVQCHTILGQKMALDRIAFSSPSEDGRLFAQHVMKGEHLLAYE